MRYKVFCLLLAFCTLSALQAQEYRWKVGFDYFFDNTEYGKSSFIDSETMNGIWLSPTGSIVWDSCHSLHAGVNLLKIPGMQKAIDKTDVTVYYQYQTRNILFRAGSFSRNEVLNNYNTFFFKDSVNNFIPLIQGIFFRVGSSDNFLNAWFDRTGYATPETRESFFGGLSGRVSKNLFFADFQSYMFHYSGTHPATPGMGVSENMQLQASIGLQYTNQNDFTGTTSVGTLIGYERDRRYEDRVYKPVGFTARVDAEYRGVGVKNTLYVGDKRMRLADVFGGDLYWGTQFLQAGFYLKNEWYIRLIESDRAKARFNCNLHFSEGSIMLQQMLSVLVSIDNRPRAEKKKTAFPWMNIFK
jgi:hypothetical protein